MTSDKCGHYDNDETADGAYKEWSTLHCDLASGIVICTQCGQRLIPSDVLEEAARQLREVIDCRECGEDYGKCLKCAAKIHDAWSRIDAVLGRRE